MPSVVEHVEQLVGLGEVDAEAGAVAAERVAVRRRAPSGTPTPSSPATNGTRSKTRQPHGDREVGSRARMPVDDRAQEVRAAVEVAAVRARAGRAR